MKKRDGSRSVVWLMYAFVMHVLFSQSLFGSQYIVPEHFSFALDNQQRVYKVDAQNRATYTKGQAQVLFVSPQGVAWAIGTDGNAWLYDHETNSWNRRAFPEDMSNYRMITASPKLTDSQVDSIVNSGGNIGTMLTRPIHPQTMDIQTMDIQVPPFMIQLTPQEIAAEQQALQMAIDKGIRYIGGVSSSDELFFRTGIKNNNLQGKDWKEVPHETGLQELPGSISSVSITGRGHVWAVNEAGQALFKMSLSAQDEWESVEGLFVQIIANNKNHVWGLDTEYNIFIRNGISSVDPNGTEWSPLPDKKMQNIAINDYNRLWGIDADGVVQVRIGITDAQPAGTEWQGVPFDVQFRQISINNQNHVWALTTDNRIYVRRGVSADTPTGTVWENVAGELKNIFATSGGVWGIDTNNKIFFREGVTIERPEGTGWTAPLMGTFSTLFTSGVPLKEPMLTQEQENIKTKKASARIAKLEKRSKKLADKIKTAKGTQKKKLARKLKRLQKKITKLSSAQKKKSKKKKRKKKKKKRKKKKRKKKKRKKRTRKKKKKRLGKKKKKKRSGKKKRTRKSSKKKKKRKNRKKKKKKKKKKKRKEQQQQDLAA